MQRLFTQIGCQPHTRKLSLSALIKQLKELDITVNHPIVDEATPFKSPWATYETELNFFESINQSSFHIIWNSEGEITRGLALQILHAMAKAKPIVLLKKPIFNPEVDAFMREIIAARLKSITIANLPKLEAAELNFILKNLVPLDYLLSPGELTLISSRVKAYFRELLTQAKSEISAAQLQYAAK